MIVGLCGDGFPEVERVLRKAMPDATILGLGRGERPGPQVDVLVPMTSMVDEAVIEATRPKLILQFGVGLQGVDLAAAERRGVPVANVPAAETGNATAVAEIAVLHALLWCRRFRESQDALRAGQVCYPVGNTLAGKTATVLGLGAIGTELVIRLQAMDVHVRGVGRRDLVAYSAAALVDPSDYYPVTELRKALHGSQLLFVCCPLTEQTRGLVGAGELSAMPVGGCVVNVSRGAVVDYPALLEALRSGRLDGAGLDVTWQEPIDLADPILKENTQITPHIGGVTEESYTAMANTFAEQVYRWLRR